MASADLLSRIGLVNGTARSEALAASARRVIPGGCCSVRRMTSPLICVRRGTGPFIEDLDGNVFLDNHGAFGAGLFGHRFAPVDERVAEIVADVGVLFGIGVTEVEVELATRMLKHLPAADEVAFVNAGSDATFHVIRLARAATGRRLVVKFQGCYHGYYDYVARNNLSAPDMIGQRDPLSAGALDEAIDATLVCTFNDLASVEEAFARHPDQIAAVIVEPIALNPPCILPVPGFLPGLQSICEREGALFVCDEVLTGFRLGPGGAQAMYDIRPDLSTFGKAMGNGWTVGAIAGRRELMERFNMAEGGDVWLGGTHNGSVPAMAAALATIEFMEREPVAERLSARGRRMAAGLVAITDELGVPAKIDTIGGVYRMLYMDGPLTSYTDAVRSDGSFLVAERRHALRLGLFEKPENFGRALLTYTHTEACVDRALEIHRDSLKATLAERGMPVLAAAS